MNRLFEYPDRPHGRRHGPSGYAGTAGYRPWLRDEFAFRCVYCLRREAMGQEFGEYAVDHFLPVAHRPDLATDYGNLLYVCVRCNLQKSERFVADPLAFPLSGEVSLSSDGELQARTRESRQIIRALRLNSTSMIAFRRLCMDILELSREHAPRFSIAFWSFQTTSPT